MNLRTKGESENNVCMMSERHSDSEKFPEIRLGEYQEIHEDNVSILLNFIPTKEKNDRSKLAM